MTDEIDRGEQPPQPNSGLRNLDRLVGTWQISGGARGRVTYEWLEGGFFLLQQVDLEQYGHRIKGIEIIGHERPFGAEPAEDLTSRFYDNAGNTLDYVYELEGDQLTIWGGQKGSPAFYKGTFSDDDAALIGEWCTPVAAVIRRLQGGSLLLEERPAKQSRALGNGGLTAVAVESISMRADPCLPEANHQTTTVGL